jgi:carbon-monoxide dehydrogenase medium subunit
MLRQGPGRGALIAGGTALGMAHRVPYEYLVDIGGLGLDFIKQEGRLIRIGSTVTIQRLSCSSLLQTPALKFLGRAAFSVADRQIRNMATVGGNLVSGYPAADLPAAFLALDAKLKMAGADKKEIDLPDFFQERTAPGLDGGLVTEVVFPVPPGDSRGHFIKLARTENDVAILDLACVARGTADRFEDVRIALGCAVPRPLRLTGVEQFLRGKSASPEVLEQASRLATEGLSIRDNIRGGRAYREQMIRVLLGRSLLACAQPGGGQR